MFENKRKRILDNFESISARNSESKEAYNLYQCHVRTQTIMNQAEKEQTLKLLMDLKKNDPLKHEQRLKLVESIRALNDQMKIGARIEFPDHSISKSRISMSVPRSPKLSKLS